MLTAAVLCAQAKELSKLVTVPKRMLPWRMIFFKQILLWADEQRGAGPATLVPLPGGPALQPTGCVCLAACTRSSASRRGEALL